MRKFFATYILIHLYVVSFAAFVPLPAPDGYILDQADILSDVLEQELQLQLTTLEQESQSQLSIVTMSDLQGYTIEEAALETARAWGVGQAQFDNGVLLLVAPNDRSVRIEVGYGLEGVITDAESSSIIHTYMIPYLRENRYDEAMQEAVDILDTGIRTEEFPAGVATSSTGDIVIFIIFFLLSFGWPVIAIMAQSKSWIAGGVIGSIMALIGSLLMISSIVWYIVIIGAILGLIIDYILSTFFGPFLIKKTGNKNIFRNATRKSTRSGSFGGFGGGGFGGGGASGRW